jgi:hypothetical protein
MSTADKRGIVREIVAVGGDYARSRSAAGTRQVLATATPRRERR